MPRYGPNEYKCPVCGFSCIRNAKNKWGPMCIRCTELVYMQRVDPPKEVTHGGNDD